MGKVEHINPVGIPAHGYTNVVVVQGAAKTIYIGGQNAVNEKGDVVGMGDLAAQTHQALHNVDLALEASGAKREHIIKWNVYIVQGNDFMPGYQAFQAWWGDRPNPPAVSMLLVAGLARPGYLLELEAIAIVPE